MGVLGIGHAMRQAGIGPQVGTVECELQREQRVAEQERAQDGGFAEQHGV